MMCLTLLVQLAHNRETPLHTLQNSTHILQEISTDENAASHAHFSLESFSPPPPSLSPPSSKIFVMQQNLLRRLFNLLKKSISRICAVFLDLKVNSGPLMSLSHLVHTFRTSGIEDQGLRKKERKKTLTSIKCLRCSRHFHIC